MKKIFTTTAIIELVIAAALFAPVTIAKPVAEDITALQANISVDVVAEINTNINSMLTDINKPTIKQNIDRQLSLSALQLKTNALVRHVDEQLPAFKFKVVIAD